MGIPKHGVKAWVLVTGGGRLALNTDAVSLAAEQFGSALAEQRCGLVTCEWYGVDLCVTQAFIARCTALGLDPDQHLVQFIRANYDVQLGVGQIVRVKDGTDEWLGPQNYAQAVILLSGRDGTYNTFLGALRYGLPRFPMAATGGEAARAYKQMDELWGLLGNPGMSHQAFRDLNHHIDSREDAQRAAQGVVSHIVDTVEQGRRSDNRTRSLRVLLSYDSSDREWMAELRLAIRPMEMDGRVQSFADVDIRPGEDQRAEIARAVQECDIAVLLLSAHFLASERKSSPLPVLTRGDF